MATTFFANVLHMQEEKDFLLFALADDPLNTKHYLLLTRTLDCDEMDEEPGMDQVYMEYNDEIYSAYGGIKEIELGEHSITIRLHPEAASVCGTEETIEVFLSKNVYNLKDAENFLIKLFANENTVEIRTR